MALRWREEGSSSGRQIDLQCDSIKMDHYARRKLMEIIIFSASKRRKMICQRFLQGVGIQSLNLQLHSQNRTNASSDQTTRLHCCRQWQCRIAQIRRALTCLSVSSTSFGLLRLRKFAPFNHRRTVEGKTEQKATLAISVKEKVWSDFESLITLCNNENFTRTALYEPRSKFCTDFKNDLHFL